MTPNPNSNALTRRNIERDLESETTFLILEDVPNQTSHGRDPDCVSRLLTGKSDIKSLFRCNLKDGSGARADPNQYYHVSCVERILVDLTALIHTGDLKVDGPFHQAIEDWFRYGGRTFDASCYETYNGEYRTWEKTWSKKEIERQLSHSKSEGRCELCRSWHVPEEPQRGECLPTEPKRSECFPDEPSACLLSKALADVAGLPDIDT
jgi:hypothetical protein